MEEIVMTEGAKIKMEISNTEQGIMNIEVAQSNFFLSSFPARPAGGDIPCSVFDIQSRTHAQSEVEKVQRHCKIL